MERALKERLKYVAGDLNYLKDNWDQYAEQEILRMTSTTLRRLLTETHGKGTRHLIEAWESMGFEDEPSIKTYANSFFSSINQEEPWDQKIQNDLINEYNKTTDRPFTFGQIFAIIPEDRAYFAVNGGAIFREFGISQSGFSLGRKPIISNIEEVFLKVTDF